MLVAIAAILGSLLGGGGIATVYQARAKNRALDSGTLAQVTTTVQGIYESLTRELREEVDRVLEREKECQVELVGLRRQIVVLRGRVDHVAQRLDDRDAS